MFCSRCGKKVLEYMLFCPFCGAEIVIPEQELDDGADDAKEILPEVAEGSANAVEHKAADDAEPAKSAEPFERSGSLYERWDRERSEAGDAAKEDPREERRERDPEPRADSQAYGRRDVETRSRRDGEASTERARRSDKTYVPDKAMDEDDIFMDDISDDNDSYEERRRVRSRASYESRYPEYDDDDDEDDEDYEDDDGGSFLTRHIRAFVGLLLFVVLIAVIVLYGMSDAGQRNLARINATLPLNPRIYASLGKESYDAKAYSQAGQYYERALIREGNGENSYNYAQSAVMAYDAANERDREVSMLKKCIEIKPTELAPYTYLLKLYPNDSDRPVEITRLIQRGYQLTGDERLNIGG